MYIWGFGWYLAAMIDLLLMLNICLYIAWHFDLPGEDITWYVSFTHKTCLGDAAAQKLQAEVAENKTEVFVLSICSLFFPLNEDNNQFKQHTRSGNTKWLDN